MDLDTYRSTPPRNNTASRLSSDPQVTTFEIFTTNPDANVYSPTISTEKANVSEIKTQKSDDDSDEEQDDTVLADIKKNLGIGEKKSNKASSVAGDATTKRKVTVNSKVATKKSRTSTGLTQTLTDMYEPDGKMKAKNKKVNEVVEPAVVENNPVTEHFYDIPPHTRLPTKEIFIPGEDKYDPTLKPLRIVNLRKYTGWKLEVMADWNNGARQWGCIHGVLIELDVDAERFMQVYGLTFHNCGYVSDPRKKG